MSLALLGIIFVQMYWVKENVNAKEEQFTFNATQSLVKVADEVQNREVDEYYVKYISLPDTVKKPDQASFSQLFHVEKNDLTNETYILTNSILQEDYKVRSEIPGSETDSIDFKKLINTKVTLVRKEDLEKEMGLSAQEKFERVNRLEDKEKTLLLEAIKEKTEKIPVYKRVDKEHLRNLIKHQLRQRGITSDFEFGIFSNDLATKVITSNFNRNSNASYGVSILPSDNTNYKLYINFPEKTKDIYSSLTYALILSIIFIGAIIAVFGIGIWQSIRQRKIQQIKTDFINNMTHEFKTPIATINLALDSAKNPKVIHDESKLKRILKMIRDENHRMHAQVENVLRISKLERNELDINKERIELHDLIEDAMVHVSLIIENRQGTLTSDLKATKSTVLANESHFVNVLVNILDNAVKYSPEKPALKITTENTDSYVIIKISDHGIGMSKSVQKKIFEQFYRVPTGDIHNVKGHGLGLAYVKKIVDDHQGIITVESEKGKGSTFIIKLPLIS